MTFEYVKALHIIFVVTWFAGLFYIVRLFIYQTEALQKPELERSILKPQLDLMASRLWYIITWPSAVLTLIFGTWVLSYRWGYMELGFMHAKLGFVALLYIYHAFAMYFSRNCNPEKADGLQLNCEFGTKHRRFCFLQLYSSSY